jgi:hypothetical protein
MYYDLIASLPQLPHFERAEQLPITPLRLEQRLSRLRPEHAEQLNQARALVRWRPERMTTVGDAAQVSAYMKLMESPLEVSLRDYVDFRLMQQTLLAALRHKRDGSEPLEASALRGIGPHVYRIRTHWDEPGFGLEHLYPWLLPAHERLMAGDALGLERQLMDLNWRWLTRRAEPNMFGFTAVCAFAFKWDLLQAYLAGDARLATIRFRKLIDKVTHYEQV